MDGGGENGETERGSEEGDDAGENGVEHGADEGCDAGDGKVERERAGVGGMSNGGKDGSAALRLERGGNQFLDS